MYCHVTGLLSLVASLSVIMASVSVASAALARRLEGKVALITGGASGIGECTTRLLSKHGAKVVIADIQDELGHSICKDFEPSSTSYVHCDVTKEEHIEEAVNTTVSKFGKLDIMHNSAGIVSAWNHKRRRSEALAAGEEWRRERPGQRRRKERGRVAEDGRKTKEREGF